MAINAPSLQVPAFGKIAQTFAQWTWIENSIFTRASQAAGSPLGARTSAAGLLQKTNHHVAKIVSRRTADTLEIEGAVPRRIVAQELQPLFPPPA